MTPALAEYERTMGDNAAEGRAGATQAFQNFAKLRAGA